MKHIRTILFLSLSLLAPLFAVDPEVRKAKPDQLKKMLADNPGNTDLAIDILRQLLIRSRKDRNYAVERLHALVKIGALSTTDQDLLKAQTVMFSDALKRKDTFAASHVIRNLEHLEGKGPYWQLLNIQLLAAVHRLDLAWNAYDFLSRQISTSHSDTRVRRVLPYIQRLFYKYKAERFNVDLNQGQNIQWIESISKGIDQKDALAIQTVMEDALKRQKLFIDNEKSPLQKNLWRELITKLSMDPKSVTNFRALQETGAKKMTRRWRQKIIDRPDDDLLKVWRNFPWSNHGYIALFEYANRELSRGNPELAARCFKDLQKFSHDDRQRRKAETAYFLCLAETPSRHDELRALLAKADSKSERSWFGKPVKLDAIIKSLKIESAVVTDYKMDHKRIQLPRISSHHPGILYSQKLMPNWSQLPWPLVTLQSDSKTLFVSAPTFIAGYAPDNLETPIWIQQNASLWRMGSRYEKPFIPDLAFPAIGKNRIYSRWAYPDVVGDRKEDLIFVDGKPRKDMPALQHRRLQKHITCFDSSNGKMIWTTVDKTYWQKCIPAGDPILNGERLYVSAIIQDLDAFNLEESDFYVFCLDPKNGNLIWSRLVGRTRFSVSPKRREWVTGVHAKLTFHQGSLYAVSNGGLMARLDARDGLVEWSRSYKGYNPLPANFSHYIAKLASPPIILDDLVIMPAKDQPGLMALDRARGNIVWESPYIPRSRIIGHLNGRLFVEGRKTLVSVDVKTGEAMWIRNYRAIPVHAVLNKDKLSLIHGSFYQAIDIDTGKNLNQQAQKTAFPHNVTQISSTWYELNSDRKGGGHLSARKGQRSSTTKLYVPSTDNPAMIYLYADGFLEAVKTKEQVTAWQKLMPSDLRQMYFDQQQILIIGNQSVKSMHAISGDHRWVYRLPSILEWSRLDRQLLLRTAKTVTLLDLTTGKQIWQKPVPYFYTYHSMHLTKTAAHLFGRRRHKKEKKNTWTGYIGTVDSLALATGAVIKMTTFPEAIKAHRTSKSMARFNESNLWMFGAKGHLFHMDLNSYKVRQFGGNFIPNPKSRWEVYIHDAKGGTIFVETDVWRGKRKRYLFKASSTKGINIGPGINYLLNENLICEIRGRRLRIHNPATKKDQVIAIVPPSCEIKAHHLSDNLLYVASVQSPAKQEISPVMKSQFRIDVFDINKGHFVYGKRLPVNPAYWSSSRGSWGNQFVWTKSHLFITDNLGLHSLALGSEQDLYERKIIYRASQKIVVDGHDNDFVAINAGLMPDKYKDVKIYATHDDRFLYLSVSYKNLRLSPLLGSGRF
ncbi:MAG: PQQ-like beta-propeller repeat protein, partial [Lentisphaeria bacterium]|nr:PQQ-like beta-propeller repeat protein [Lentisphaeria bacterium]